MGVHILILSLKILPKLIATTKAVTSDRVLSSSCPCFEKNYLITLPFGNKTFVNYAVVLSFASFSINLRIDGKLEETSKLGIAKSTLISRHQEKSTNI